MSACPFSLTNKLSIKDFLIIFHTLLKILKIFYQFSTHKKTFIDIKLIYYVHYIDSLLKYIYFIFKKLFYYKLTHFHI